jgi:hypothetical protein
MKLNMKNNLLQWVFAACVTLISTGASAGLTYTCDSTIDATVAGTCATLNSSIAGLYNNTFSNANADIYIQYGTTGLGESTSGFLNLVSYNAYRAALMSTASHNATDTAALASLPIAEPALYNGGKIQVTSALGQALGLTGLLGTTATGAPCSTPGSGGCYNGIITITSPAGLLAANGQSLYYRTGPFSPDAYDFYSVVEHETDEVLGSSSCIDTGGASLADGCGGSNAAAVDLFRYNAGSRVFIDGTPGAYFSSDGGVTKGEIYNTLSNGDDYADFITNCKHVQDATGCLGQSFDITTDGGVELSILDSVGFNLRAQVTAVPEPESLALFGLGVMALVVARRKYKR